MDSDGVFINEAMKCVHHAQVESKANRKYIAELEAEVERLREACEPLYQTEWPHRVFDIVVDKDFALAEQFAGVMHDIHAALEPLP